MKENNTFIAGSFILDVLYGTNYSNDIDIYDGGSGSTGYRDYHFDVQEGIRKPFMEYLYQLDLVVNENNHQHKTYTSWYEGPIYMIRDFMTTKSNKKMQHIIVRSTNVMKFIDNSFDLDICKTCFDGEKLYIKNMDKIINKYDFIKPFSILMVFYASKSGNEQHRYTMERMHKYISRGFNINKHDSYDSMYEKLKEYVGKYYVQHPEDHDGSTCEERGLCGDKFNLIMNMIQHDLQ